MKVYERDGKYLCILPNLPQWFVVDSFGKDIALSIVNGQTIEQIKGKFSFVQDTEDIVSTYNELKGIIRPDDLAIDREMSNSLMDKSTVAMISVTRNCNLKCPHCYVDATGKNNNELSLQEYEIISQKLFENLAINPMIRYSVNITGGEPFFRKDIIELLQIFKNAGFNLTMSTNGLMIDKDYLRSLLDLGVAISISLDGATAITHDQIRGIGTFVRVVDKIKALTDYGVKVGINCLLHSGNFHELEEIINISYLLGCSGFNPINLVQLGRACSSDLKRVNETEVFPRIAKHLNGHPEQISLFMFSSLFSSLGAALLTGVTCLSCGIGNRPCIYIDDIGRVYPCPNTQKEEFLMGDLHRDKFEDCIDLNHKIFKRLREIRVDSINPVCSNCDVRYFCGGDCRGETYNVTGDLYSPYIACQDRHNSLIELMWIVSENPEFFQERAEEYLINFSRAV